MIALVHGPLPVDQYQARLDDLASGGLCVFEGRVRTHNDGRRVSRLEYEGYEPMALRQMALIREEAMRRWNLGRAVAAHRLGHVPIGEAAVWVGVACGHRAQAFEACRFMIDAIKERVPVWKRETYTEGDAAWVAGTVPATAAVG